MKIDTYYDITCSCCARSRSTDFEKGMHFSKPLLSKQAKREGWGEDSVSKLPICPDCMANIKTNGVTGTEG